MLRKKGQAAAPKKAQRATSEGLVSCYIHAGGKIGVLVEMNCESDFVARTEDFQRLCHDVAMHIAALDPRFLRREEVTQEILDREREIYREQAKATGKPEPVIEKIVNGKMEKFYEENCLYEQHFIRDEGMTIKELVDQAIAKIGENIAIRRFSRFKVGETDAAAAAPPSARSRRCRKRPSAGICALSLSTILERSESALDGARACADSLLECPRAERDHTRHDDN